MSITRDAILGSPDHYLHSFDGPDAVFVPMNRESYHRSIFLDGRIVPAANGSMKIPVSALSGALPAPAETGWIFHIGHCGSTLLARALDRLSTNLVLREPLALRQTAVDHDAARLALVRTLSSRRYIASLPTIVKANVPVNFIISDLVGPETRAIFLFSSLRNWLLAVLRSPDHRLWITRLTEQLSPYLGFSDATSDAERAAALWLAQIRAFSDAQGRLPHSVSLDSEVFFEAPGAALSAAAACLELPMNDAEIRDIVDGPLFGAHAKNPAVAFDNNARLARRSSLETALGAELEEAEYWLERAGGAPDLNRPLTASL